MILSNQEQLYTKAISIIDKGRNSVITSIYKETTKSYYLLGRLIVEDEQKGEEKAEYGKSLIKNLSKKLTIKYGKGFSVSTLKDCRKFYQKLQLLMERLECTKSQSVIGELNFQLSFTHYTYLMGCDDSSIAITKIENNELIFHKKISQEKEHANYGGVVP
ncbi:MAG TPA: DUF1016 family protein, partial [Arcobacter sp.]|nr:DUF1016 family protein [Arcobacter sp.]